MPEPPPLIASREMIGKGAVLYHSVCFICHGVGVVSGGSIRDLRYMTAGTHEIFNDIVLDGVMSELGMASFADQISEEDSDAIHAFIIARAHEDWAARSGQ